MNKELPANTNLSHYCIVAKLGAGGMGEVWLAEDTRLKRKVALKVLPDTLAQDTQRLHRFEQEALAASALNHPNILTIHEFGTEDETHFLASEFIDGETLRARLQRAPLALDEALDIAIQVAQALTAAHKAHIIHRDIKPENVMLRKDGIVKVLDFGLAKLVEPAPLDAEAETRKPGLTQAGTVMGTVAYMSPEQARGQAVDVRTDLFSLGVMLYEMLTRRQPFTGETINHVIVAILEEEPPSLEQNVPAELTRILKQALAKNADERYPQAQAMLADLKKLQKRLEYEAEFERPSSANEAAEAQTLMLQQTTAAAPEAVATAAGSARPTMPDKPKAQRWWLAGLLSLLVLAGGFFGYRYFTANKPIESIAVMPFVNESGNPEVEYLTDGMTETLINSLSQLPNLSVKARSSVFRYKGREVDAKVIATELNVQAILTGRVVQRGDQVMLNLELIDAQTETTLWGNKYERKSSDLVNLQSEIARDVSSKLKAKLSGAEAAKVERTYTANTEAYQLYLKGKFYWNKRTGEALRQAAEFYNQAVEKDPNYALAYSGLAETYVLFSSYDVAPANDSMPQAKAAALRALEVDEQLAEAHTALGFYLSNYEWDRDDSEKEYRRAIELKPNYATAHHWLGADLSNVKRFDESLVELKRAEELDPLSRIIGTNLGDTLVYARRYDEAIAQYKRTLVRDPNFAYAHRALGWAYGSKGMYQEAVAETRIAIELDRTGQGYLGLWLAKSGKHEEAVKLLDELKKEAARNYVQSYTFALIYIGLGDKEEALNHLEKHMTSRAETASTYAVAPELDDLRSEPRFKAMLKQMNLLE
ncbi:MAG TPA: protein kinase [Candidatus Binatia bacterium]|nr:protein kinase [Candidatus Binatia bacterium]